MLVAIALALTASSAPGFFRVEKSAGTWWFLSPSGERFWSLGVNCVTGGVTKEKWNDANPSYAWWRYHSTHEAWAEESMDRLRRWGFNTLGAWSDYQALNSASKPMPYTEVLYFGTSIEAPASDLFSPEAEKVIEQVAKEYVPKLANDPNLIGWFSDNELGWWDDTLFVHFMAQSKENHTKQRLVALIEEHYGGDWDKLLKDWKPERAKSFSELLHETAMVLRPGGDGMKLVNRFIYVLADRYYKLCRDAIRRYDKNHLYLGDRYIQWYPQEVARAAGKYVDVVSTNYGADWTSGNLSRFYLENLHAITSKPILITEFYFCAMDNRSGNKNTKHIFPTVDTQGEREAGFQRNLSTLVQLPYVIGAHWFQYFDEPTHGREDGEDYNMGLVDIHNKPYDGMLGVVKRVLPMISARGKTTLPKPDSSVPPAGERVMDGLREWDVADTYLPSESKEPFADLYACWSKDTLYLAVHTAYYADKRLWGGSTPAEDQMQLTLTLGGMKEPIRAWFGVNVPCKVQPEVPVKQWDRSVKTTLLLSLDASLFGKSPLAERTEIPLQMHLAAPGRAEEMSWGTTIRLRR